VSAAGLLLAAGAGRRLGRPKALVRFDGALLVERGVRLLHDGGCDPVIVVLGAAADEVMERADLAGVRVVRNEAWESGMGSSVRCGLAALAGGRGAGEDAPDTGAGAAVVALVDQPLVGAEAVRRLIAAWRADPSLSAAVATYDGRPRNPVLLARSAWPAAADAAEGDVGGRAFLRGARGTYDACVAEVACDGTGLPDDVDTPAQLAALTTVLTLGPDTDKKRAGRATHPLLPHPRPRR